MFLMSIHDYINYEYLLNVFLDESYLMMMHLGKTNEIHFRGLEALSFHQFNMKV